MSYLPHRFSNRSVYRFVPIIVAVLESHTATGNAKVAFDPLSGMNLSIETAVARLRDAVHALSSGLTTHPSVDAVRLKAVWKNYKVTSDGVNVLVRSRTAEQDETVQIHTDSRDVLATLNVDDSGFVETLSAFAVLLGRRFLQGQVEIIGDLSLEQQEQLMSNNDVVIVKDPKTPNKYNML